MNLLIVTLAVLLNAAESFGTVGAKGGIVNKQAWSVNSRQTTGVPGATSSGTSSSRLSMSKAGDILEKIMGGIKAATGRDYPGTVMGEESIMSPKEHGTSDTPVQENLRWDCDYETADRICNYNRHAAEYRGYWRNTSFLTSEDVEVATETGNELTFYDSNSGKPLFVAPRGRDMESFLKESFKHGWPSFRDEEVVWDNVRVLPGGEAVSVDGTHLGHNIPDINGNRHCINLVSVAGRPTES